MLFSISFKNIATSALAAIALWIFLSFFISLAATVIANNVAPVDTKGEVSSEMMLKNMRIKETVSLFSPMVLYSDASATIINPTQKTTRSLVLMGPMERISASRFQNPLSLGQSIIVVYPHLVALVAITLLCFAISYLVFMLQEIRT
jgi:ABC-2 type transport system permease protein